MVRLAQDLCNILSSSSLRQARRLVWELNLMGVFGGG